MKRAIAALYIGLLVIGRGAPAPKSQPYTTWSAFGGTPDSLQYSALTQEGADAAQVAKDLAKVIGYQFQNQRILPPR